VYGSVCVENIEVCAMADRSGERADRTSVHFQTWYCWVSTKNSSDRPVDLWDHTRGHWCICEEFLNEGAPTDCPGVFARPSVRTQFMCSWDFKNEIHLDV
jgi:hypothetical protein